MNTSDEYNYSDYQDSNDEINIGDLFIHKNTDPDICIGMCCDKIIEGGHYKYLMAYLEEPSHPIFNFLFEPLRFWNKL